MDDFEKHLRIPSDSLGVRDDDDDRLRSKCVHLRPFCDCNNGWLIVYFPFSSYIRRPDAPRIQYTGPEHNRDPSSGDLGQDPQVYSYQERSQLLLRFLDDFPAKFRRFTSGKWTPGFRKFAPVPFPLFFITFRHFQSAESDGRSKRLLMARVSLCCFWREPLVVSN